MIFFQIIERSYLSWAEKRFIEKLYKRDSKRLWYTAFKIVNNTDFAEDVVQQTFEKIIKKVSLLRGFKSKEKVSAYVYIVAKNTAISHNRLQKDTVSLETFESEIADSEDIEYTVLKMIELEEVKRCIARINPVYSDVFTMRYFLGMEYRDIADSLSISLDTARKRASTCRALLKEARHEEEK